MYQEDKKVAVRKTDNKRKVIASSSNDNQVRLIISSSTYIKSPYTCACRLPRRSLLFAPVLPRTRLMDLLRFVMVGSRLERWIVGHSIREIITGRRDNYIHLSKINADYCACKSLLDICGGAIDISGKICQDDCEGLL
jgi:hypothetical protein